MVKRFASAAVGAVLAAAVLASIAGCGAGASRASDLMASADLQMMKNWKAVGVVSISTDELISWLSGALSSGSGIDQGGFEEEVEADRARLSDIDTGYRDAGKEYQRIIDMNSPGGYADYARLKLLEITSATALANEFDGFLIRTSDRMSKTGLDAEWFASEADSYRKRHNELHEETVKLARQAAELKKQRKLGQ